MRAVRILLQVKGHDVVGPFRDWIQMVHDSSIQDAYVRKGYSAGVKCQLFNVNQMEGTTFRNWSCTIRTHVLELRLALYISSYLQRTMMILIILLPSHLCESWWMTSLFFWPKLSSRPTTAKFGWPYLKILSVACTYPPVNFLLALNKRIENEALKKIDD